MGKKTLEVPTIKSSRHIANVSINDKYDLIWVGSVFTHVPQTSFEHLLKELIKALTPSGQLIFTTAGNGVKNTIKVDSEKLISPESTKTMLHNYYTSGYGFAPYQNGTHPDWGRALTSFDYTYSQIQRF